MKYKQKTNQLQVEVPRKKLGGHAASMLPQKVIPSSSFIGGGGADPDSPMVADEDDTSEMIQV